MYTYKAKMKRVVDGDTVVLDVDLGFNVWMVGTFRLSGIDAPELRGEEKVAGDAAKIFLSQLVPVGTPLVVFCEGRDKYGRWVAMIETDVDEDFSAINLSDELISEGHAVPSTR